MIAYMAERDAGPAPQMGTVHKDLRDLARQTDRLRRRLEFACWGRRVMDELTEPPLPTYGVDLDFDARQYGPTRTLGGQPHRA